MCSITTWLEFIISITIQNIIGSLEIVSQLKDYMMHILYDVLACTFITTFVPLPYCDISSYVINQYMLSPLH